MIHIYCNVVVVFILQVSDNSQIALESRQADTDSLQKSLHSLSCEMKQCSNASNSALRETATSMDAMLVQVSIHSMVWYARMMMCASYVWCTARECGKAGGENGERCEEVIGGECRHCKPGKSMQSTGQPPHMGGKVYADYKLLVCRSANWDIYSNELIMWIKKKKKNYLPMPSRRSLDIIVIKLYFQFEGMGKQNERII